MLELLDGVSWKERASEIQGMPMDTKIDDNGGSRVYPPLSIVIAPGGFRFMITDSFRSYLGFLWSGLCWLGFSRFF